MPLTQNKLLIATNNANKLAEFRAVLQPKGFEVLSLRDLNINIDVVEDSDTFEGNALKKAREIFDIAKIPTIADDSGLCVDALNGAPGVYSARYASDEAPGERTHSGDWSLDDANNNKLLRNMDGVKNRTAHFTCALAIVFNQNDSVCITKEWHGLISDQPAGDNGFGYDVIFYLPEYKKTSAQISPDEKNKISHRAQAINALVDEISVHTPCQSNQTPQAR
ncbi:MAG: RdgB/HAM1 family non-canonical purine NTP pyrophosphatase [Clostridiales bacterium]|jgi:XTP/dITP diphosphohydrolase|nr:RdgB/HAM1 family non-canonical purine NTP pyrophosphatase [Clostridiales bacterium]